MSEIAESQWYVVHAYSGHEDKVRNNLLKRVESMDMHDKIFDVLVPTEEVIEIKDGQRRHVQKRIFPGYILVNMFGRETPVELDLLQVERLH